MGAILIIAGIIIFLLTFVKPKTESEAKKLEVFRNHKWIFRIGGFIVMSVGAALMPNTTSQSTSQTKQAVETTNTSKSTVQTSKQHEVSHQREVKLPYGAPPPERKVRKAVLSFYKHHYPEATVLPYTYSQHHVYIIGFPYKHHLRPVSVGVINARGTIFTVNCYNIMHFGRKECLSSEGRSIVGALYHIYHIKKPTEAQFIKELRHKCLDKACTIRGIHVESGDRQYVLYVQSLAILAQQLN